MDETRLKAQFAEAARQRNAAFDALVNTAGERAALQATIDQLTAKVAELEAKLVRRRKPKEQ